jgi:hypothetical protein
MKMEAERSVATYPSTVTSRRLKSKEICRVLCLSLRAKESNIVSFRILTYFIVITMYSHCMITSDYPDWGCPCFFLSCKANARVKPVKTEQGSHSSKFLCCSMYLLCCSVYFCVVVCTVCFVSFSVLFMCICVLNYCHRVATELQ